MPYFAAYDKTNYIRWGLVYIADMRSLFSTVPELHEQFMNGKFTVHTNDGSFNGISPDLALEHVIRLYKGTGVLNGITRLDDAGDRWLLTLSTMTINERVKEMVGLTTNCDHDVDEEHW